MGITGEARLNMLFVGIFSASGARVSVDAWRNCRDWSGPDQAEPPPLLMVKSVPIRSLKNSHVIFYRAGKLVFCGTVQHYALEGLKVWLHQTPSKWAWLLNSKIAWS